MQSLQKYKNGLLWVVAVWDSAKRYSGCLVLGHTLLWLSGTRSQCAVAVWHWVTQGNGCLLLGHTWK